MIEATSRTAAEHCCTRLVNTLIKFGGANMPLLIIVVCGASDDFGVRGAGGATAMACVRLDTNWTPRWLRASRQLALSRRPVRVCV